MQAIALFLLLGQTDLLGSTVSLPKAVIDSLARAGYSLPKTASSELVLTSINIVTYNRTRSGEPWGSAVRETMPRRSPFKLVLKPSERAELERRSRSYTSLYRDVVRARIVLYAAEALGNDEIAARLDTPRQIVSKWRKRFFEQRLEGLEEQPRRGRPAGFSPLRRRRG